LVGISEEQGQTTRTDAVQLTRTTQAALLAMLFVLWRLPMVVLRAHFVDRLSASVAFDFLRGFHNTWPFSPYLRGQDYMGVTQELLTAGAMRVFGASAFMLNFPCLVMSAAATALAYLALLHMASRRTALFATALMICANASLALGQAMAWPDYEASELLIVGIILATLRIDRRPSLGAWMTFAAISGLAMYTFSVAVLQVGVSTIWLFARQGWITRLLAPAGTRKRLLIALTAAVLLAMPPLYRYLTRPWAFRASRLDQLSVAAAGAALIVSLVLTYSRLPRIKARVVGKVAILILLLVGPSLAARIYFNRHVLPGLIHDGVPIWSAGFYTLQHRHSWPSQLGLLFRRIVPVLFFGASMHPNNDVPVAQFGMAAAMCVLVFPALVAGAIIDLRRRGTMLHSLTPCWLLVGPVLLTLLVLTPSYRMSTDMGYRYLIPFFPGWCTLLVCGLGWWIKRPTVLAAVIALYAAYCAYDMGQAVFTRAGGKDMLYAQTTDDDTWDLGSGRTISTSTERLLTAKELSAQLIDSRVDVVIAPPSLALGLLLPLEGRVLVCTTDTNNCGFLALRGSLLAKADRAAFIGMDWQKGVAVLPGHWVADETRQVRGVSISLVKRVPQQPSPPS